MPRRLSLTAGLVAFASVASVARSDGGLLYLREEGAAAGGVPTGAVLPREAVQSATADDARAVARAALGRAREQFLAYGFSDAAATLQRSAIGVNDRLLREDRALAVELQLWAGACALLAGNREGARMAFRRATALAPEARLPEGTFPPEVELHYSEVQRAGLLAGPSAVTVRSAPTGARIELDGRSEGVTPVTLRLASGVHHLRLERTGWRAWTGPLSVEGAGVSNFEVVLSEATGVDLRAQLGRPEGLHEVPDTETLARMAREYGVSEVLVMHRDGRSTRWPRRGDRVVWPWIVAGAAVAAGVGVGLFFLLNPRDEVVIVAP